MPMTRPYVPMLRLGFLLLPALLAGCGLQAPRLSEPWEAQDVSDNMIYNIKQNIFCEAVSSINRINALPSNFGKAIPDNYSMQLQLTLAVAEATTLSPTVTYNRTFPNGAESGVTIGQNFGLGFNPNASSTATRTDTTYTYWNVGRITKGNEDFCKDVDRRGSSLLLSSDLGIYRFLDQNVRAAALLRSSKVGNKKPEKIDVYSYDLKFAVVTGLGIAPSLKLVSVSGLGAPILNLNRTRTHELLLTFGPSGPDGFEPSGIAFSQQQITTLKSSLRLLGQ